LLAVSVQGDQNEVVYVPGRSGDIIVRRPMTDPQSSTLLLINKDSNTASSNTIDETSVADLISHVVGGPIVSESASRTAFPKGSVFDKSASNLLFVVDSFGGDVLKSFPDLQINKLSGKQYQLQRSSYPEDSLATITSMSTGTSLSNHGIVAKSWNSPKGQQVVAYKAQALTSTANVADVISQTFNGKSITLSMSNDFQMASALGAHQMLNIRNPLWNNNAFYWNSGTRRFESVYVNNVYSIIPTITSSMILDSLSSLQVSLPAATDSISYNENKRQVIVDLVSKNIHAVFDIGGQDVYGFFTEMYFVRNLLTKIQHNTDYNGLITDSYPDLFSFAISSLKGISSFYGKDSAQFKAAVYIMDATISQAIEAFQGAYNNKISCEIVLLAPSQDQLMNANKKEKDDMYKKIHSFVQKDILDTYFPSIYLKNGVNRNEACDYIQAATDYEVHCFDPADYSSSDFYVHQTSNNSNSSNSTNGSVFDEDHVARYQTSIWVPIVLILALIAIVYAMASMDVGADSMVYRSSNVKPHAQ